MVNNHHHYYYWLPKVHALYKSDETAALLILSGIIHLKSKLVIIVFGHFCFFLLQYYYIHDLSSTLNFNTRYFSTTSHCCFYGMYVFAAGISVYSMLQIVPFLMMMAMFPKNVSNMQFISWSTFWLIAFVCVFDRLNIG